MAAFAVSVPLTSAAPALATSFTAAPLCQHPAARSAAPTMILRTTSVRAPQTSNTVSFGGVAAILDHADEYMAYSVLRQYLHKANPTGEFSTSCTEGSVKGAAEAARVRVLGNRFRAAQAGPSKAFGDLYESRKRACISAHSCHHEESQFSSYPKVAAQYNLARAEAMGTCSNYAYPETVEEHAMLRYMDIQQNIAANPTGVYNTYCNEGSSKGQAEDIRVASLNAAFRQGQKPLGQILQEKYNQRQYGYSYCNGCSYEEGIVTRFPAVGAAFRSKVYGY